jgi:alcohol dehydrogenase, propanol-preferring
MRGSFVGNREDMAEALIFAAQGKVEADIGLQPLLATNDVFTPLQHGEVPSRVVLDFQSK